MTQGEQEFWKFILPDKENMGNLPKTIKNRFLHRTFTCNTGSPVQIYSKCVIFIANNFFRLDPDPETDLDIQICISGMGVVEFCLFDTF